MLIASTSRLSQVLSGSSQPCGSPREGFLQRPPAGRGALGKPPCPEPSIALGAAPGHSELRLGAVRFELPPCSLSCCIHSTASMPLWPGPKTSALQNSLDPDYGSSVHTDFLAFVFFFFFFKCWLRFAKMGFNPQFESTILEPVRGS